MRETNSVEQSYSRYVQGGLTDRHNNRLGWWERRELPKRDDDNLLTVQPSEAGRPDLISRRAYSTERFAWLVLQYNSIVDVATELKAGARILMPNQLRLMVDVLNQTTGGKVV